MKASWKPSWSKMVRLKMSIMGCALVMVLRMEGVSQGAASSLVVRLKREGISRLKEPQVW